LKTRRREPDSAGGIAIVSNDARRAGAPLIALNIARELAEVRGIPIVTILLGAGELEAEFSRLGPLLIAPQKRPPSYHTDPRHWARMAKGVIHHIEAAWHEDPIDTMFRPDIKDVAKLFPGTKIVSARIVRASSFGYDLKGSWRAALWLGVQICVPIYRPREWVSSARYI
jgi:hypothetical protein